MTDASLEETEPPTPPEPRGEIAGFDWRLVLLIAATVSLGVFGGVGWLIVIAALVTMIFLHELGHFLTAKWSGMKVTEFFLFFGPKIWSFKRGETEYGIKCIPLGAYVRIIGMSNMETDVPPEDERRTYRQQSYPKRLLVVSAGSIMHMLQAFVLLIIVFSMVGVPGGGNLAQRLGGPAPDEETWTVGSVSPDSAAEAVGLRVGDDVVSIDGRAATTFADVGKAVGPNANEKVEVIVDRGGERLTFDATLGRNPDHPDRGFLGIGPTYPEMPEVRVNPIRGAVESGQLTVELMGRTVHGLGTFFTGGVDDLASDVVDGGSGSGAPTVDDPTMGGGRAPTEGDENRPISIYGIARWGVGATEEGLLSFLFLMVVVNISIGLLNMIPLLPLDGGHAAIATYERIRSIGGRRYMADVSRLLPLTYAVLIFMAFLGVSSIYLDIVDPVG